MTSKLQILELFEELWLEKYPFLSSFMISESRLKSLLEERGIDYDDHVRWQIIEMKAEDGYPIFNGVFVKKAVDNKRTVVSEYNISCSNTSRLTKELKILRSSSNDEQDNQEEEISNGYLALFMLAALVIWFVLTLKGN